MEPGKIMYYNWNRVAFLHSRKTTPSEKEEVTYRIGLQNAFAGVKSDQEADKIALTVEKTLSEEVIKSVDMFMKNK